MTTTEKNTDNGRFTKGNSGNPLGRPPGSRNQSKLLMESLLEGEGEQLTRKLVELAKDGNIQALRICMDRVLPAAKDRTVLFDLPPIQNLNDISAGMRSIAVAIGQGTLTPQEGETISRTLEQHANVMVYQDLQARVEKLERGPSGNENQVQIVTSYR
jgi:hypothetical protein